MGRRSWGIVALAGIVLMLAACSSSGGAARIPTPVTVARTPHSSTLSTPPPPVSSPTPPARPATARSSARRATPTRVAQPSRTPSPTAPTTHRAASTAQSLPLGLSTRGADQVITVTADSSSSTTATLQAWRRVSGGWRRVGPSVPAHLGSDGIGRASESSSRTPAGSFTLTQAFGADSDPGTALPYRHTDLDDWWISESGPLYNTHQICSFGCSFDRSPNSINEHLVTETPYYNYAVVIDYNTRNAPGGVRAAAGSAFFLHVTVGEPTAGCVSIPQDDLVRILRWLSPSAHPRILISIA